jgi:5'-3' exonuclease
VKVAIVDSKLLAYNQAYTNKPIVHLLEDLSVILDRVGGITDVLVAFDNGKSAYRLSIWPGYKGTRTYSKTSVDNGVYLDKLPAIVSALGMHPFIPKDVEADDVAGILTHQLASQNTPVVLITSDQDWYSMVLEYDLVQVFDVKNFTLMDKYDVFIKTKCRTTEQFLIKKCILGDSSDNILGVPKIGPVKFAKWAASAFDKPGVNLQAAFLELCKEAAGTNLCTHRNYVMEGVHSCEELLDFNMRLGRIMHNTQHLSPIQASNIKAGFMHWKANRLQEPDWAMANSLYMECTKDYTNAFGDPLGLSADALGTYMELHTRRINGNTR